MSTGAHVGSIDAVRHFRAVLHTFSEEAREALSSYDTEVQRTLDWLLDEMPQRWKSELRKSEEELQQARIDLERCRNTPLPGGGVPSCMEQKKAFAKAKAKVEYVQDKIEATRRWGTVAERESSEYSGRSNQLASLLDAELPKAIQLMDRVLNSLEAYRSLRAEGLDNPLTGGTAAASVAQPAPAVAVAAGDPAQAGAAAAPAAGSESAGAAAANAAHTNANENGGSAAAQQGRAQP